MKTVIAVIALAACATAQPQVGASGLIDPLGKHVQFTHAQVFSGPKLVGASGIVFPNGENIQLTQGQADLHNTRAKRSPQLPPYPVLVGPSAVQYSDGSLRQLTQKEVEDIVVIGPSGIVKKNGVNEQLGRKKRSTGCLFGASGAVCPGGNVQFPAHGTIVTQGNSGIVFSHGKNVQLPGRRKRSTNPLKVTCIKGPSALNCGKHGLFQLKPNAVVHEIGDTGVITSLGNFQFTV